MLLPCRSLDSSEHLACDAGLGEAPEAAAAFAVIIPYRGDKTNRALLNQIGSICAHEEIGPCFQLHKTHETNHKRILRFPVAALRSYRKLLIA